MSLPTSKSHPAMANLGRHQTAALHRAAAHRAVSAADMQGDFNQPQPAAQKSNYRESAGGPAAYPTDCEDFLADRMRRHRPSKKGLVLLPSGS
jgi:hypothetical protein